jgi:hypothetical protein
MRLLLTGFVVAAITLVVPMLALAGNQEIAEDIASNLRNGGQLSDYKVGVKYQDGTAWLRGRVRNQQQMNSALKIVFQTPGVTRVVNGLTMEVSQADSTSKTSSNHIQPASGAMSPEQRSSIAKRMETVIAGGQPEPRLQRSARPATGRGVGKAQQVASSFRQKPARLAAAIEMQAASSPMSADVSQAMIAGARATPIPVAYTQFVGGASGRPIPAYVSGAGGGVAPARYDQPCLPNYAWPSYAAYPNYAGLTYPRQYSPTAWPFIGPFYPYPQVPLGWRKVTLEWDDGWWMLDFKD